MPAPIISIAIATIAFIAGALAGMRHERERRKRASRGPK